LVAGLQKLKDFSGTVEILKGLGMPAASLIAIIVIIIEIPVALSFAAGYKTRQAGYVLMAFTFLTIVFVHNHLTTAMDIMMALKNIAIMGGIMAAISCACDTCVVHTKKKHDQGVV
jgi:putative oxidoreductase